MLPFTRANCALPFKRLFVGVGIQFFRGEGFCVSTECIKCTGQGGVSGWGGSHQCCSLPTGLQCCATGQSALSPRLTVDCAISPTSCFFLLLQHRFISTQTPSSSLLSTLPTTLTAKLFQLLGSLPHSWYF